MDTRESLIRRQRGMVARRQLTRLGIDRHHVRSQVRANRWAVRTPIVISTFTGPLGAIHRQWLAVLHAGGHALIGGLTAAARHGLQGWERDTVTVLVGHAQVLDAPPGVRYVRTRRPLDRMRDPRSTLPLSQLEPAVLMFAAYEPHTNTAFGAIAAVVQQRTTTAARLRSWLARLPRLPRAPEIRTLLDETEHGADSWSEVRFGRLCDRFGMRRPRRQTRRRGLDGRTWYTDCEWDLPGGDVMVLEIQGPFHMEAHRWSDDLARQRQIAALHRHVIQCTTIELRHQPERVFRDLQRWGVPRA